MNLFFIFFFIDLSMNSSSTKGLVCSAASCCHSNSVAAGSVMLRRMTRTVIRAEAMMSERRWFQGLERWRCIRDPRSVHLVTERHCLFSQCLSLAYSARLLTTTIVFGVPREASCLPVLWTELPVWTKGGVVHLFISSSAWKEVGETLLTQRVHYDLWLLLACVWCGG